MIRPLVCLLCAGAVAGGCSAPDHSAQRAAAQRQLDAGIQAWESADLAHAEQQLTPAIRSGSLDSDQYVEGLLMRALVRAALGKYRQAHADLDRAQEGAAQLDRVFAIRAYILQGEGQPEAARRAMEQAREVNPGAVPYVPPRRQPHRGGAPRRGANK
jgi:Tfp pilus assembly protein PilF